jgi:hypothetical protein
MVGTNAAYRSEAPDRVCPTCCNNFKSAVLALQLAASGKDDAAF